MSAEATIRTWMDTAVEAIKRAETAEAALAAAREENRRLVEALEPFAKHGRIWREARTDVSDPVLIHAGYADNIVAEAVTIKTMQDAARSLSQDEAIAQQALPAPPISPRRAE